MAPRKKAAKKSNQNPNQNHQNSQPSKFGIQHFFDRHTQNSLSQNPKPIIPNPDPPPSTSRDPPVPPNSQKSHPNDGLNSGSEPRNGSNSANVDSKDVVSGPVSFRDEVHLKVKDTGGRSSQNTPDENLIPVVSNVVENQLEASPDISKSVSVKRFKFSPGMVIKQSQDDGGEAVTWKISPVNERLHAVSKHLPYAMRVLADSSRVNTMSFQQCSQNKNSADSAFQLDKWLSSPPLKATGKSLMLSNGNSSEKADSNHDMDLHGNNENATDKNNNGMVKSQSPFTTPPSLSYCHDKPADGVDPNVVSDLLGSRQHKKALLDLLDQVEDVISVEELACKDTKVLLSKYHDRIGNDKHVKSDLSIKGLGMRPAEKVSRQPSNLIFLVLEVSEKQPVASSGHRCPFKVLRLLNEQSGEERAVHLLDEWFESVIAPGDTVHVIGEFDEQGKCDVSHDSNFLIVHPNILVSGTRVASSFTCPRRTVLDERLKGGEHSAAALIGTLLHQIFQAGLIREFPTKEFLEEYARVLLQKNIEGLYACGVNEGDTHKILMEAIPRLLSWVILFRDSQGPRTPSVDFGSDHGVKKVEVSEVMDIEEMAWAPKYGLKGMIDASLRVKVASNGIETNELIMPLEFKSGKATSGQTANEHRAQVMLYTLLMSERYQNSIDSGLLYYLHTDQTQGVVVRRSDLLGLIMRRNELANDILKASTTQRLPPMLRIPNMCKSCRHLNFCTIYHKAHGGCTETSGLGDMYDSLINHLTDVHGLFLEKWDRLIDLEAKESETVRKEIWSHSEKRANSASCISSIVLDTSDKVSEKSFEQGSRFSYRFVRQDLPPPNKKTLDGDPLDSASSSVYDLDSSLKTGDYVILSTESDCLVVASGVMMDISRSHVTVSFSKRLRLPGGSRSVAQDLRRELWRIDKDEFMGSFAIMRFNLIQLFLQNEESSHLRRMIVDLEAPRYDNGCLFSQDPAVSYIWSEKNLNDDQRTAILKILTAKDYTLVLGMPGTGKTSTMVHAVKALLMRGSSILLTSYTNSAVDNLLVKLKSQGIDFIRIGRDDAVHEEIRGHCISAMDMRSTEDIKLRLDQAKVVAVTCLGITSPLLTNKRFDVCIMDEAGQTTLPVSLGPLLFASMFVLVGDHYQLPPLVKSAEARENGMAVSLFCRLSEAHPQAISALQSQYRMCASIMKLSNGLIYGNRLRCGSPEIENAKLKYRSSTSLASWLKEVLEPDRPVIFINTDFLPAFEVKDGKSVNNPIEAYIVSEVTETLVRKGIRSEDIGIITPYNSQTNFIRQAVSKSVEINTIDKYQGRDKDCILVSFVRSSNNPRSCVASLLGDWHRINVALTRAKKKLVMVGSCRTLSKVPLLKLLIEKVEEQSGILSVSNKDINPKGELKRCSQLIR